MGRIKPFASSKYFFDGEAKGNSKTVFCFFFLIKVGSLDNVVQELSVALSSCHHYTRFYEDGKRTHNFYVLNLYFLLVFYILGVFLIKQLFHSRLLLSNH